ncbi:putative amidase signature domain-containing protein [Helianthus debilis subsp. tardiflorus]
MSISTLLFLVLLALLSSCHAHKEATILELRAAFNQNRVNSRQLVEFYLGEIKKLNPVLKGVLEVNPDALYEADRADRERAAMVPRSMVGLHGIPVLLKDTIATKDKLNTTAGSFALLGSIVPRDAGIVSGCGKQRAGNISGSKYGGSTETDGSILCPSSFNSVVGVKPTVGLTSHAGVIPISPSLYTVGQYFPCLLSTRFCFPSLERYRSMFTTICRTVSDAAYVLDTIVGSDYDDGEATRKASRYIPPGGYTQFLKHYGLKGKRIGIVRNPFFVFSNGSNLPQVFESHLQTLSCIGEFKIAINAYLKSLVTSRVRSLADIIAFNQKFGDLENIEEFGQEIFLAAEATNGIGNVEKAAIANMARLTRDGYEKMMLENRLGAVVTPGSNISPVLAIGGFPAISVPAAYDNKGVPIGICFSGLKWSEPTLIEISYGFEQATNVRKIPTFIP